MRTKEIHEKNFSNYNRIFSFSIWHYYGKSNNGTRKEKPKKYNQFNQAKNAS